MDRFMGMDKKISFPPERRPTWPRLVEHCAANALAIDLRMIDGELAFPDEQPPENWREIRVGTHAGMITMRRESDGVSLVIWGNADEKLRDAWNRLALSLAELTAGVLPPPT
jgi:hypothetical protein